MTDEKGYTDRCYGFIFSATNLSALTIDTSCECIGTMTNCLLYAHEGIAKEGYSHKSKRDTRN